LLRWYTPTGSLKESGMRNALVKMEGEGKFVLPASRGGSRGPNKPIPHTARTAPREDTFMPAGRITDLRLEVAEDKQRRSLWNEYVDRYHYLGYSPPAGAYLRYFAYSGERELACSASPRRRGRSLRVMRISDGAPDSERIIFPW
jgi:hypothetical protein